MIPGDWAAPMTTVADIAAFLEMLAPCSLAEQWDNVGLLVGDGARQVGRVMTCLTVTPASAAEAVAGRAELIVAHHPLPFRPLKRLTAETPAGRMLLDLVGGGVAVYSPHTAFDSAAEGINQRLAVGLGLCEVRPLVPAADTDAVVLDEASTTLAGEAASLPAAVGTGRYGRLAAPLTVGELAARVKALLRIEHVQMVGDGARVVQTVAVGCGSAAELLEGAASAGCEALVTGEARFHACLEAEARKVALVLAGHYATERFGIEALADVLAERFPSLEVWASRRERDPLVWL